MPVAACGGTPAFAQYRQGGAQPWALITLDVASHRFFKRDGEDVRLDLPITLDEAVTGAKVRVPTVEGPVTLTL